MINLFNRLRTCSLSSFKMLAYNLENIYRQFKTLYATSLETWKSCKSHLTYRVILASFPVQDPVVPARQTGFSLNVSHFGETADSSKIICMPDYSRSSRWSRDSISAIWLAAAQVGPLWLVDANHTLSWYFMSRDLCPKSLLSAERGNLIVVLQDEASCAYTLTVRLCIR